MNRKYRIGIVVLVGLAAALMLLPGSPIHSLAAAYCQKRLGDRLGCSIEHERLSIHPLRGTVALAGVSVKTPADSNPKWSMKVKKAYLGFQYGSLLRKRSIQEVRIEDLEFRREELAPPAWPLQKESNEGEEPAPPTDAAEKPKAQKPIRIARLFIRNGSVEFVRTDPSGQRRKLEASEITLFRTDVALDKSLPRLVAEIFGTD